MAQKNPSRSRVDENREGPFGRKGLRGGLMERPSSPPLNLEPLTPFRVSAHQLGGHDGQNS